METIHLDDFLEDGILKEKPFREKVEHTDWNNYHNKKVLIKGCTDVPVPTWAYLIITAQLSQSARRIYFGELRSAVKIYVKDSSQF
tara:strand:+ start:176 stop:433 length:258 start_codon:yes stop_codon:yes gene_type:complete